MISIFDIDAYGPYRSVWAAGCARYEHFRAYYYGQAYNRLRWEPATMKLYEGTRTLFSPLRKAVRIDVAKIPAGWALPRETSQTTLDRVKELRKLTGAELVYKRFLKYAAVSGEAAIMLSGEPGQPELTALRPDEVILGNLPDGTPVAIVIKRKTVTGLPYLGQSYFTPGAIDEYAQVITPEKIETYRDGVLFDFDGGGSERPNRFGFIPVAYSNFEEGEHGYGEPSFAGALELLDRVNEIASLTLDVITRNAEPLLVGTGVTTIDRDDDSDAILVKNENAKFYTIDPQLPIAETLAFIQDVRAEYKTMLPQLRLDDLITANDLAYDTVMTMLQELGDHVVSVRTNIDSAVETVERWMLGTEGGIPDDYEIDRDRRWLALTESQQLDLEAKRLKVEGQKITIEGQKKAQAQTDQANPLDLESKRTAIEAAKKALEQPKPSPGAKG